MYKFLLFLQIAFCKYYLLFNKRQTLGASELKQLTQICYLGNKLIKKQFSYTINYDFGSKFCHLRTVRMAHMYKFRNVAKSNSFWLIFNEIAYCHTSVVIICQLRLIHTVHKRQKDQKNKIFFKNCKSVYTRLLAR